MRVFHVDTFTDRLFAGNSAAVCPLDGWLPTEVMQRIAEENGLAETAFFVAGAAGYDIRWFTPEIEMDLCGHATLASAHVLACHLGVTAGTIRFGSRSGPLEVMIEEGGYTLILPARPAVAATAPDVILRGMGVRPLEVLKARDYLLVYKDEETVRGLRPDRALLDTINLDPGGIVATGPGRDVDFVCRYFTPQASIFEDPVTGSAFCTLIPYWSARLGITVLRSHQVSRRGGVVGCRSLGDSVAVTGGAVTFSWGEIDEAAVSRS